MLGNMSSETDTDTEEAIKGVDKILHGEVLQGVEELAANKEVKELLASLAIQMKNADKRSKVQAVIFAAVGVVLLVLLSVVAGIHQNTTSYLSSNTTAY